MDPFIFAFWVAHMLLFCVETMKKPRCEATAENLFYVSDNQGLSSVLFSELKIHRAALELQQASSFPGAEMQQQRATALMHQQPNK